MISLVDKELTGDSEKLTLDYNSDQEKEDKRRRSMDHIIKNHMFEGKQGKSVFLATNRGDVWTLIQDTLINPVVIRTHRSHQDRRVYKKKFDTPVGVRGLSGTWCYFVTVIYDIRNNHIVTAFPCM